MKVPALNGFSLFALLFELLIVAAIVSVIAVIAIQSARRADAARAGAAPQVEATPLYHNRSSAGGLAAVPGGCE
jgi:Tfp pilus assembly protein PilE